MGLGQERDFYGHPDQSSADDNITKGEGYLGEIVNRLNEAPDAVSQENYALLVAALSVRTKKMREAMAGLAKTMAQSMGEAFDKHSLWRQEMDTYWSDRRKIDDLIEGEVSKQPGLNRETRAKARAFVKQQWMVRKREIYEEMDRGARVLVSQFFERMDAESAEIADRAFTRVFEGDPTVPKRVDNLKEYRFSVMDVTEGEFILGDCAAIGIRVDGQPRLAIGDFDQDNPLAYIFLPISPQRCVVASRLGDAPPYTVLDINRFSASLSHRFFISKSAQVNKLEDLRELIGTAEPLASEADVAVLMRSIEAKARH